MVNTLDWEDIRFFVAVTREGSLSGAARSLKVHASTVSRRLESLEQCLDVTLFRRTTEGLAATETALRILEPSLLVERQMHLVGELASGEHSNVSGRVRLSVTTTFDQFFLSAQVAGLMARYPDLRPQISSGSGLVDLVAGDADIAVRFGTGNANAPVPLAQEGDVHARRLATVACRVYVSSSYLLREQQNHQIEPSCLKFIAPIAGMPGSDWVDESIRGEQIVAQSNYYGGTLEMVEAGLGAAILPDFVAARGRELVCLEVPGVVATRSLWILWPTDLKRVARVQAVVEFIVECVAARPCIFDRAMSARSSS